MTRDGNNQYHISARGTAHYAHSCNICSFAEAWAMIHHLLTCGVSRAVSPTLPSATQCTFVRRGCAVLVVLLAWPGLFFPQFFLAGWRWLCCQLWSPNACGMTMRWVVLQLGALTLSFAMGELTRSCAHIASESRARRL